MNVLKVMIVMLVLIMSVGAVCAAENVTDEVISDDGQEIMGIDSGDSFTDLINEINNATDELNLTHDYKFNNETDNNIGIFIDNDNFVINGNGHTIDGNDLSRIFIIRGNNITINNLTLINANSDMGSILYIPDYCSINTNNVVFANSTASNIATIFVSSSATYVSLEDKFLDLTSKNYGAITLNQNANAIFNSAFMMNSKELIRGFILALGGNELYVSNSVFANTTSNYTAAIRGSKITRILNCSFINLHASISAGAILLKDTEDGFIANCTFTNVTSEKNAGAILCDVYAKNNTNNITIMNSDFTDCYSGFGGALVQLGGNLLVDNCNFTNNSALFDGGAIYTSMTKDTIFSSVFDNNYATYDEEDRATYGGAIYCDNGSLMIFNSNITNNVAKNGAGISLYDSNYTIKNNTFDNNHDYEGNYSDIYTEFDSTICIIENNTYSGNDTLSLNNTEYEYVVPIPGMELNIINNTIDVDTLPIRFDLRDWGWVSPVKDQGLMGACWTFSTTGAIESAMLRFLGLEGSISENNMQDVSLQYSPYGTSGIPEGGSYESGAGYALSWLGVHPGEYDTYDEVGKISPLMATPESIHVQDVVFIPRKNISDNDNLKRALLKYGALSIFYHSEQQPPYCDMIKGYQYFNESGVTNHGVTLIGWDDTFSASNFLITPPGDGAWIFKNSWGTEKGQEGYFYISYYDLTFGTEKPSVAFVFENDIQYSKNYQYDINGIISFINKSNEYMNTYEAIENDLIAAVGTYFNESGINYTVEVYVNDVLKYAQNGVSPFYGFHTIKLDSYIPIKEGDIFAVKIISNSVAAIIGSRQHHEPSSSQYLVNGTWIDSFDGNNTVCSIKVYTLPLDIYTQDLVKIYKNDSQFEANIGVANETVTFEINGESYTRTSNENGTAKMNINLNPGNYTIKTTFNDTTVENTITVLPTLIAENLVKYYRNASQFYVLLIDGEGNPVSGVNITMNINGVFYDRTTNENGTAKLNINLEPGEYILTAIDPLTGLMMSYNITVLPVLSADNMEMTYMDGSTFNATVIDGQGNPLANASVTFNINGVFYIRHTDSSGIARLNIRLMAGEYIITSEYDGMAIANTITIKD